MSHTLAFNLIGLSHLLLMLLVGIPVQAYDSNCSKTQNALVPIYRYSSKLIQSGRCLESRFQWNHSHIENDVAPESMAQAQDLQISEPIETTRLCRKDKNYQSILTQLYEFEIIPRPSLPLTSLSYYFEQYLKGQGVQKDRLQYNLKTTFNSCKMTYGSQARQAVWNAKNRMATLYTILLESEPAAHQKLGKAQQKEANSPDSSQ